MSGTVTHSSKRWAWRGRRIGIALLVLACFAAYWLSAASRALPREHGLLVRAEFLDFGEVWESRRFEWILPVQNTTDGSIEILDFHSSCVCLSIEPRTFVIAPGHAHKLRLTLDLSRQDGDEVPTRRFAAHIVPRVRNGMPSEASWTITGRVRSPLTAIPEAITLSRELIRGQPVEPETVKVTAHTLLSDVKVSFDRSLVSVTVERAKGSTHDYDLRITPQDKIAAGLFKTDITVQPIGRHEELPTEVVIPVRGIVVEDVKAIPSRILFGPLKVGSVANETVALRSLVNKSFDVEAIESSSPDAVAQPVPESPAGGKTFRLSQRITQAGNQKSIVSFVIRRNDGTTVRVSVEMYAHGIMEQER